MEVHLTPEQEQRLSQLATQQGRDESTFLEAVKRGEEALDRGEYLTHEQVGERIEKLFRP
jgi:predicted transcriptional regulator